MFSFLYIVLFFWKLLMYNFFFNVKGLETIKEKDIFIKLC